MKDKKIFKIAGATMGFIGIALIGENSSYWLSFGVFLMLFGNNLDQTTEFDNE